MSWLASYLETGEEDSTLIIVDGLSELELCMSASQRQRQLADILTLARATKLSKVRTCIRVGSMTSSPHPILPAGCHGSAWDLFCAPVLLMTAMKILLPTPVIA